MQILIIDHTTEGQAICASRVQGIAPADLEAIHVEIRLSNDRNYPEFLENCDAVILGSLLHSSAVNIARSVKIQFPELPVIMFVQDQDFSEELVRLAHFTGVRKVLPETCRTMDLLQELIGIDAEFRRSGRSRFGKLIAFTSPKGGVGTTTLAAGLGELSSMHGRRTLLWDFDADTRDLSRALLAPVNAIPLLDGWINSNMDINSQSLEDALVPMNENTCLLAPPRADSAAFNFLCGNDVIPLISRIADLARYSFDNILVDIGTVDGPGARTLLQHADQIVVLTGECPLSMTATELYVSRIKRLLGTVDNVSIVSAGDAPSRDRLRDMLGMTLKLPETAWALPAVPTAKHAGAWPASGKTLYSLGGSSMKNILCDIAEELKLFEGNPIRRPNTVKTKSWFFQMIKKAIFGIGGKESDLENVVFLPDSASVESGLTGYLQLPDPIMELEPAGLNEPELKRAG